jgi:dTDP-4-amino-4,6-dideoxygalactose transaminase
MASFIEQCSSFVIFMVPLLDLTRQYQTLKTELDAAVIELLGSGHYVLGPAVDEFEAAAAQYLGVEHAIGVANGTDALLLSLRAMGIGPGDEIITSPFTFIATAEVASLVGATPVFVDIEPDTLNIDPAKIEAAITPRTKAIVPIHLFGHPAPMDEINAIARKHGLRVLEDAAQAWGASQQSGGSYKRCGALADMGSFSFFPSKNLGACGEGGLVSTNDDTLAESVRMLRVHGQRRRYIHDEVGYNSRLHALQAKILSVKLPHADSWNDARRANADRYKEMLGDLPIEFPAESAGARHVYHQYTIRLQEREPVCEALTAANVGWAIYYPVPLHMQPVYASLGYNTGDFPETERAAAQVLTLPVFPELFPEELQAVVDAVRSAF